MFSKIVIALAVVAATAGSSDAQERAAARSYDNLVTGSVYVSSAGRSGSVIRPDRRQIDSSAKGGNSEHPNFLVPNYGGTSGGPAY